MCVRDPRGRVPGHGGRVRGEVPGCLPGYKKQMKFRTDLHISTPACHLYGSVVVTCYLHAAAPPPPPPPPRGRVVCGGRAPEVGASAPFLSRGFGRGSRSFWGVGDAQAGQKLDLCVLPQHDAGSRFPTVYAIYLHRSPRARGRVVQLHVYAEKHNPRRCK